MNEYGFLALDIDGTVVNSKKEISSVVKAEINRIQEAGIPVALVSGRPTKGIEHIAAELNFASTWLWIGGCMACTPFCLHPARSPSRRSRKSASEA